MHTAVIALIDGGAIDGIITSVTRALGGALVLWAIFRSFKDFVDGRLEGAIKRILISAIAAAILFQPELLVTLINAFTGVVSAVIKGISNILGGSGAGPKTPTSSVPAP